MFNIFPCRNCGANTLGRAGQMVLRDGIYCAACGKKHFIELLVLLVPKERKKLRKNKVKEVPNAIINY